jgi:AmmeMemoRadiSam system protein A
MSNNPTPLLQFARQVLEMAVQNPALKENLDWIEPLKRQYSITEKEGNGIFVTLKVGDALRGCVGSIRSEKPFLETLALMTLNSAFHDPRFPPLSSEELPKTKLAISILSPLKKINSTDEIIPHQHGLYLQQGNHSGLFLPKVWDMLPNKEDFLKELCVTKAGLPIHAYQDPQTTLYIFTVEQWEES